ncbi:MAG: hypothetical protein ACRERV_14890, partial [Methylococcales bacterium]
MVTTARITAKPNFGFANASKPEGFGLSGIPSAGSHDLDFAGLIDDQALPPSASGISATCPGISDPLMIGWVCG